jgi:uncharacterized membrane protein
MSVGALIVNESHAWLIQFVVLLFLIGIPALVIWGVMSHRGSSETGKPPLPDPEQILKVRLARGEIDSDEYERLLVMIREDRTRSTH